MISLNRTLFPYRRQHGERLTENDAADLSRTAGSVGEFVNVSKHQDRFTGDAGRLIHGKTMRINLTRMTLARITNSDDSTTEVVAERPTPSVPPCVRMP